MDSCSYHQSRPDDSNRPIALPGLSIAMSARLRSSGRIAISGGRGETMAEQQNRMFG